MEDPEARRQANILIVEDEALIARNLAMILRELGHQVGGIAGSAREAIQLAAGGRIDLAMMDITIRGELDGIQLAELIWNRFRIPSMYVTAHTDPLTVSRISKTQALGFVVKPFRVAKVQVALDFALHQARSQASLCLRESRIDAVLRLLDHIVADGAKTTNEKVGGYDQRASDGGALKQQLEAAAASLQSMQADLHQLENALHHEIPEPVRTITLMCQVIQRAFPQSPDQEVARALDGLMKCCTEMEAHFERLRSAPGHDKLAT